MNQFYRQYGKRIFDIIGAMVLLIVFSPVVLIAAIAVRVKLGSPVLFRQQRPGLNAELFMLCKFRTMTLERDSEGNLLSDADRLTGFGKLLRSTSLDELPQLWNVLKGEMSLIGPRPLLVEYLKLYSPEQARRQEVRPGVTGLAQVLGRNSISWEEKFAHDVRYVDQLSLATDIRILLATLVAVVRRGEVQAEGHATMPFFTNTTPQDKSRQRAA